jgi:DNA-directed RNA polymerase II subunit RPB1
VELVVKDVFVSGIKHIKTAKTSKRVVMSADMKEGLDKKRRDMNEYIVFEAEGSNLRDVLTHPKVNPYKSYCNDINEIFNILGIEAARSSFINEFKEILKPYSIYVNHRHLSVLADWMSTRGTLTAINRNGINRVRDVSILRKASFEETTDILFGAAVFSEVDQLRGVSERIIFGEPVKIGTRSFEVMIDRDTVKDFNKKGKKDREHEL